MPKTQIAYPLLLLDASSRRVWVGLKRDPEDLISRSSQAEATASLAEGVKAVLADAGIPFQKLAAFAFCRGPGSTIGIRTCVMMLRTWRHSEPDRAFRFFEYDALQIGLALVAIQEGKTPLNDSCVAIDARRQSWCIRDAEPGESEPTKDPQLIGNDELARRPQPVFSLLEFPSWTKPARPMRMLHYRPEDVFCDRNALRILTPCDIPNPLQLRATDYKKWEPAFLADGMSQTS